MKKRSIIIYFGDWWDERWRRRQQLASRLAEKEEVERLWYIEFPASIPELIKSIGGMSYPDSEDRWRRIFKQGFRYPLHKIEIITPASLLPYFSGRFGFDKAFVRYFTGRLLRAVIKKYAPTHRIILWMSHPFAAGFIGKLNEECVCYDCTEKFSEFKEWEGGLREKLKEDDAYITRNAHLVFTQTTPVFKEKKKLNPHTYLIPNAVDYRAFTGATDTTAALPDIASIKKPILGFIGMYNDKIDGTLMAKIAETFSHCSVVMLGIYSRDTNFETIHAYSNLHYLGLKHLKEIPPYLSYFDVCLAPYKIARDVGGSPLKLFDYLASGKPIVATRVSGTEDFGDVVTLAEDHKEYLDGIRAALTDTEPSARERRMARAAENSWSIRADEVWDLVKRQW